MSFRWREGLVSIKSWPAAEGLAVLFMFLDELRGRVIGLLQAGASQSAAFLLCSKTGGAGVLWERLVHDGRYNGKLQGQWIGKEKERFHAPRAHHRRGDCGDFVSGGYAGYPWHDK